MSEESLIVQEYYKNPVNNYVMDSFTVAKTQGNPLCGDSVTVYLVVEEGMITGYSYAGTPSLITSAAASLLSDLIVGVNAQEVLHWTKKIFDDQQFIVSYRRRRAVVSALLAVRNALHDYFGDSIIDEYDDVLE